MIPQLCVSLLMSHHKQMYASMGMHTHTKVHKNYTIHASKFLIVFNLAIANVFSIIKYPNMTKQWAIL